jgi:hypothetical protein
MRIKFILNILLLRELYGLEYPSTHIAAGAGILYNSAYTFPYISAKVNRFGGLFWDSCI